MHTALPERVIDLLAIGVCVCIQVRIIGADILRRPMLTGPRRDSLSLWMDERSQSIVRARRGHIIQAHMTEAAARRPAERHKKTIRR